MWKKQWEFNDSKSDRYTVNNRVIRNRLDRSQALTYRETPEKRRGNNLDDNFDRDSDRRFRSTAKLETKRNRIFQELPRKVQHFEIGARMYNLNFQQLDVSILPRFFYSKSCGCQNSLEPCNRITHLLTKEKLFKMRVQYQQIKQQGKYNLSYFAVQQLLSYFPLDYPQAYKSIIENLLQLVGCDEVSLPILYSIVWHCKCEHLSFFVYSEVIKLTYQKHEFGEQVKRLISTFSKDLSTLLERVNQKDLQIFFEIFCESAGTNLIPIQQYGKYIQHYNKEGHLFPGRVLFIALLDSKKILPTYIYDLKGNIPHLTENLKNNLPWGRVFEAATHRFIKK